MRIYNSGEKQESRDEEPSKDSCYYAENDKVVLKAFPSVLCIAIVPWCAFMRIRSFAVQFSVKPQQAF